MTSENENRKVVLIASSRTPIGKLGGKLRKLSPADLGAHVLINAIKRAHITHQSMIDSVVFGHAVQSYFEPNTARIAVQKAGLPESINTFTVHQQCASGINATYQAWADIKAGRTNLSLAVGVESMSLPPLIVSGAQRYTGLNKWLTQSSPKFLRKLFKTYGPLPFFGLAESGLGPRNLASDPAKLNMLKTAQIVANLLNITREEADEFSAWSQANAIRAAASGRLAMEIDPLVIPGVGVVDSDEHPRKTDVKTLSKLPAQAGTGLITAGNASGMGDGACALVLCTEEMARELGVTPIAEIVDFRFSGRHATTMGLGPVNAAGDLLAAHNMTVDDIKYWELNEAFSYQALACLKVLGIPLEKVNHNGGGISLSHPLGMTGARIIASAAYELELLGEDLAIATLCVGGGMGAATLIKRYNSNS